MIRDAHSSNQRYGIGRRPVRGAIVMLVVLLGLHITRHSWLSLIGGFLVVEDPLHHADALVPLAGERVRITAAAELFNEGYADWFVLTEMHVAPGEVRDGVRYSDLVRQHARQNGIPSARIVIAPEVVATTYAEAGALRRLAEAHGWHSLIVITSPYHTRRARLIFQDRFAASGITINVRSVDAHWFRADHWWRLPEGPAVLIAEYEKLFMFLAGYHRYRM